MKKINKTFIGLFLMALTVAGGFTSCAYSSEDEQSGADQPNGLVLNIKTTSVGTTRTALTSVTDDNEQNVKNMVVGIFKTDGTPASITSYTMDAATSAQGLSKNITTSYTASTAATKKIEVDDKVLVALNVPDARLTDFTAAASYAGFKALALTIAETITHTASGTAIAEDALPMFGECKVAASGNTFTADVTVIHMVAKVTLASLTVDFSETLHTNAAFTPKEVFLLNVPDETDYGYTWTSGANYTYGFGQIDDTNAPKTNYYTGESTLTTGGTFPTGATTEQNFQADYIGSGVLSLSEMQTGATAVSGYTFYTLPNNSATYNTKLVIKGKYTDNKTLDATGHDAYYAVDLYPNYGSSTTDKSVQPNYNYSVTAVIKGDGADDAYTAIPVIEALETTVTSLPFDKYQNTVIFNNGTSYEALPPAQKGDLLFSDGTWGTLDRFPAKTPVGIVFSTDVSAADYTAGYTHGYAIALKDVNSSATMAWSTETVQIGTPVNLSSQALLDSYVASATYMDGRAETDAITHTANYSQAVYPAAYAAVTTYETEVAHPTGASNWYLPSIGQQYEWIKNMGGVSTNPSNFRTDYKDCYWSGTASTVASAMNTFAKSHLKNTAGDVDQSALWTDIVGSGGYYWASTESAYGAGYAFHLGFSADGNLYLAGDLTKSNTVRRVRPVLAF